MKAVCMPLAHQPEGGLAWASGAAHHGRPPAQLQASEALDCRGAHFQAAAAQSSREHGGRAGDSYVEALWEPVSSTHVSQ